MEQLRSILDTLPLEMIYFDNTLADYAWAFVIFVGAIIVFSLIQWVVLKRLERLAEKTKTEIDDAAVDVFKSVKPPFYYFLAFYIAVGQLTLNDLASQVINAILILWVIYQGVVALNLLISFVLDRRAAKAGDESSQSAYNFLGRIVKGVVWAFAILLALSNLGVNVTSLVAGLGIGGIAIAFALQNILSDLFSSFAIYFDKPFAVGDFIVVGEHLGTVEKIGIKTTRLRALQGEEIVISNQELTSARIQNFRKLKERWDTLTFGVLYETEPELVEQIPQIVSDIIDNVDLARLDRVHFRAFGDSSLDFEVAYYAQTQEYNTYLTIRETINLKLLKAFAEKGIEFAYPTRTVYMKK